MLFLLISWMFLIHLPVTEDHLIIATFIIYHIIPVNASKNYDIQ
ncbi:hypothetical protein HMPREF1548_04473 [Clostridium sp. KLE 1755]|nr:hypothetical protein HMPREF1548_04473 [Clostridium sp. KLE 1755]